MYYVAVAKHLKSVPTYLLNYMIVLTIYQESCKNRVECIPCPRVQVSGFWVFVKCYDI